MTDKSFYYRFSQLNTLMLIFSSLTGLATADRNVGGIREARQESGSSGPDPGLIDYHILRPSSSTSSKARGRCYETPMTYD